MKKDAVLSHFTLRSDGKYNCNTCHQSILKRVPAVAFTADIWKSGARKYYISLTAHMFDEEFTVAPLVLSLRQLTERHLAVNIQSFLMFELDEKFQIRPEQRAGITTDCAREMVAATSHGLFGPRHACIAHVWNNVVINGLSLWSPPNVEKFPIDEASIINNESIHSIGGDEDDLLDDEDQYAQQLNDEETQENIHLASSQHDQIQPTGSTVVVLNKKISRPFQDEFLSEDDEPVMIQPETRLITLVGLLERVFNLLSRCRQLIQDMRNIGVVQTYISMEIGNGRGFTVDMVIRWNTTFQMLDRPLEHQTIIDNVVRRKFNGLTLVQTNRLKLAALTPNDWDVLRTLHHVLTGFDSATTIVSASHYPTLSDSFWAIA
ncbi:unnamed protein product [Rotaria sp. Silwood2]|nr:unnamed protein product [Rotaria sp. Silwood2]CAF4010744.1 unnamed protein product [Rotaria sp. Silwood2]CAF4261470.1 unnamed protein product [Rotaria sp. Silwood2]